MRINTIIAAAWVVALSPTAVVSLTTSGRVTTKASPLIKTPAQELRWMPPLKQTSNLNMSTQEEEEPSKCPVTRFSKKVNIFLSVLDSNILKRLLRIANHGPALASLSYFGLISMASMMGMGPLSPDPAATTKATLASVLTQTVGTTTNSQFAALFPTNITPASFVFLVWPIIAILQLITVLTSAFFPADEDFLKQDDLSALTLANICSAAWLITSSKAMAGSLPIGSFLILPLVPLLSAYPLRNKPTYYLPAYQLYSSFTTLASFLAFAVELQYGGRIPFIGTVPGEIASSIFLFLYSTASLAVPKKSLVKRFVNFGAFSGILYKRVLGTIAVGAGGFLGGLGSLLMSFSFLGTVGCWWWSLKEFVGSASSSKKK